MPGTNDPNLLVGFATSDDAAIYRLNDEMAIVTTADFITPPVNDPFIYGQIAAANAISDIYAMGGKPLTCLNLVGFPSGKLDPEILSHIIQGALDRITEAGAVLAGGHTVDDLEPKFGLAVTGIVHPKKYWANSGAKPGDVLILTKPLGSGVLFNAAIKKWVSQKAMDECINTLITLNKTAAEIMAGFDIHAVTDVTGFGLAGHASEMALGSQCCLHIRIQDLPIMNEALEMYRKGMSTGVNVHNQHLVAGMTRFDDNLPSWHREIIYDPQTSGGLLISLPEHQGHELLNQFHKAGIDSARMIGHVTPPMDNIHLIFI